MWPYFWSDQNSLYIVDWFLKLTQLILSDVTGVSLLRCNLTLVALLSVVTHTDLCKSKRTRGRILNGVIGIFVLLLEIMKRFFFLVCFTLFSSSVWATLFWTGITGAGGSGGGMPTFVGYEHKDTKKLARAANMNLKSASSMTKAMQKAWSSFVNKKDLEKCLLTGNWSLIWPVLESFNCPKEGVLLYLNFYLKY